MELLPYPQAAHLRNCHSQDTIDFEANPPPTEPPLGDNDNDIELPPFPPTTHFLESHVCDEINDVESNLPRTELTSSYTGTPYHQRIQRLLGTFFGSKALQTRMKQLSRRPPLIQVMRRFLRVPSSDLVASNPALRSMWCCFICIDISGRQPVAMKIPCPPSKQGTRSKDRETRIYETIKERLTIYYGMSRFLPFYGVQEVQEVNV
jgi:hypothetical protein